MPEGHTIHRKVVDQAPGLVGHSPAVSSPNRRFGSGAADLDGRRIEAMEAWGKHLFYFFEGRRVLHVHLGMDGRFRHHRGEPAQARPPRRDTWLRLAAPRLTVDLSTPKVCELIDVVHQRRLVDHLGPDPIRVDDDGGVIRPRLATYDGPIGVALLDQSVVAGIGNVYRAEILFVCGIHPLRPAATVDDGELGRIWAQAVRLLRKGVADRGEIITVDRRRDFRVRDGREKYVYGQRQCAICGSAVRRWDLAGRVAYACETCQPPWPGTGGRSPAEGAAPQFSR